MVTSRIRTIRPTICTRALNRRNSIALKPRGMAFRKAGRFVCVQWRGKNTGGEIYQLWSTHEPRINGSYLSLISQIQGLIFQLRCLMVDICQTITCRSQEKLIERTPHLNYFLVHYGIVIFTGAYARAMGITRLYRLRGIIDFAPCRLSS